MRITLLPSAVGSESPRSFSLSLLVNDTVAIDAGSIGFMPSVDDQRRIRHVFLTHTHLDHVNSLPIFLDNVYEYGPQSPIIHGSAHVVESLQTHFFNNRIWPDFVQLSGEQSPFLRFEELRPEQSVQVDGISITPIALDHVVPSMGFLIQDEKATVAIVCDTLPTERIWRLFNQAPDPSAVFVEASFPNSHQWLADKAGHLTPATLRKELDKLEVNVPVYAIHIKPNFHDEIAQELADLKLANLHIAQPGCEYKFG